MTIREMRERLADTQSEFSARYNIPVRTIQNWENGVRTPPDYVIALLEQNVKRDLINRMTISIPVFDRSKKRLPPREEFLGNISWLTSVYDCLGKNVVFALDEALMCEESFLGRTGEWVVWIYGDTALSKYSGVMVLGNNIDPQYVTTNRYKLPFTCFNRTLIDAMANENILDMQGMLEALSYYYETHGHSFEGLFIPPEYQEQFQQLSMDAMDYYCS